MADALTESADSVTMSLLVEILRIGLIFVDGSNRMTPLIRKGVLLFAGALVIAAAQNVVVANGDEEASKQPLSVEEIAKTTRGSIVVVTVPDREGKEKHLGTGFVVSDTGLIATNLHVVGQGRPISVRTADKKLLPVTAVHASDRNLDLALLQIDVSDVKLQPLELGNSDEISDGTPVVVMGNPLGLEHSVVSGVISGRREMEGRKMLQLAMPIEPGNSGGPVVDRQGRVHGVVTMKSLVTKNLGFAVEINYLKSLIERPNPVPIERWLTIGQIDHRRWTTLFGAHWHQRGGRIYVDGMGEGFGGRSLCLSAMELPDVPFEVAVSVRLNDEAGAAGLVFHADGGDRHYGFYPSNGRLRLSRFDGANVFTWQVLRELPSEHYQAGDWNYLKVRIEEDRLKCYVNGHLLIESDDQVFRSGKIGLAKFRDTQAEFKHFQAAQEIPSREVSTEDASRIDRLVAQLPPMKERVPADLEPLVKEPARSVIVIREKAKALEEQVKELRRVARDVHAHQIAEQLTILVSENPDGFDLLRAALLISQLDEEDIDVQGYLDHVDLMASAIRDEVQGSTDPVELRVALNEYLFRTNGYHGSRFDYYHAANSYMNRVIDDRVGLPITLSVLYMELGRRIGLDLQGVGLPGHFIVKQVIADGEDQLIDVFNDAKILTREDAAQIVQDFGGRKLVDEDLVISPRTGIAMRMLMNLRGLAERKSDNEAILRYLEAMIAIDPEAVAERGMRALIRFNTGRRNAAIADLDWFLQHEPAGLDLDRIREMKQYFLSRPP